jgi:mannose-1-phosphate guanylyltransferase
VIEAVILAGGWGTRLWPASRSKRPKQFLKIPRDLTLLEQSVARAQKAAGAHSVWIVTLAEQVENVKRVLPDFDSHNIISEPIGRNSAAAIASAAFLIEERRKKPVTMLILTADHFIPDEKKFVREMKLGIDRASEGQSLVTFGLPVRSPSSDYGYIEAAPGKGSKPCAVKRFIEKPPLASARRFMRSRNHFWNSGMFCWRTDFFKSELARRAPKIFTPLSDVDWGSPYLSDQLVQAYARLPNISIDYALMEKSRAIEVLPVGFTWSDLGSWSAVYDILPKSGNNAIVGKGNVVGGKGNLIYSEKGIVHLFGVNDLIVVQSGDEMMIVPRTEAKNLKAFLKKAGIST